MANEETQTDQYELVHETLVRWTKRIFGDDPLHIAAERAWPTDSAITYWESQAIEWYGLKIDGFPQQIEPIPPSSKNFWADLAVVTHQIVDFYDRHPTLPKHALLANRVAGMRENLAKKCSSAELLIAAKSINNYYFHYSGWPGNSELRMLVDHLGQVIDQIEN